jgi:hypothetical protein
MSNQSYYLKEYHKINGIKRLGFHQFAEQEQGLFRFLKLGEFIIKNEKRRNYYVKIEKTAPETGNPAR